MKKKKKQVKQKEKGAAEDEMVIEHHWLNGRESEQTPGDSEGQSRLVARVHGVKRVGHDLMTEPQKPHVYLDFGIVLSH